MTSLKGRRLNRAKIIFIKCPFHLEIFFKSSNCYFTVFIKFKELAKKSEKIDDGKGCQ